MPISDVHVDPDRLVAIAEELSQFSSNVRTELELLDNGLAKLSGSWQDESYDKFKTAMQPLR